MPLADLLIIYRLQIACACFTVLVAIPFFTVKREKNFAYKLFSWLLIFQAVSLTFDMITVYTVNNADTVSALVNKLCHIVFIPSLCIFIYLTFFYIRHIITNETSISKLLIYGSPIAVSTIIFIAAPLYRMETERGNYSAGPGITAVHCVLAVYLVVILYDMIKNRRKISNEKRRLLFIAIAAEVSASVFHLFMPEILITSLGTTIVTVAIFLTVENPDRILRDMYHKAYNKIREQNKIISDSISYASKIQKNLLPPIEDMAKCFTDIDVIWKPRDVVGGDIYWMKQFNTGVVLCVVDCTGHGTPGALLTTLVTSALESIVWPGNCDDTADIMWQLDRRLSSVLHVSSDTAGRQNHNMLEIFDGCDIAVVFVAADGSVQLSSGNIPVFVCNGKEITHHNGQKIFIGEGNLKSSADVDVISIESNSANKFYIASDGLFDQIGSVSHTGPPVPHGGPPVSHTGPHVPHGIQYGYDAFKQIVLENHNEKLADITAKIWDAYEKYRGEEARRDDFELVAFKP